MRDPTQPKRRRQHFRREISDAEIGRRFGALCAGPEELGLAAAERRLRIRTKVIDQEMEEIILAAKGVGDAHRLGLIDLGEAGSIFARIDTKKGVLAFKRLGNVDRLIDIERAGIILHQVYALADLLTDMNVAEPQLRAADYLAPRWRQYICNEEGRAVFTSGAAMLKWARRALSSGHVGRLKMS